MGSASVFHWVVVGVVALIWILPLWRILERLGYRGAWALVAVFPPLALVLLWVLATRRWPIPDAQGQRRNDAG